jgi:hypothetical protein
MTETAENYFSVIEDHFRAARGTSLFMFSPLDWSLMDAWKNSGVPIEAVLRGIDTAFERWRKQPPRAQTRGINSLNYCASAIAEEAQAMANRTPGICKNVEPPFSLQDVRAFVSKNAGSLRAAGYCDLAESLESLDLNRLFSELELLEQKLTAIEEETIARLRDAATEEALIEARRALDRDLKP